MSLRHQVHDLTVTLQDVGGNSLALPGGSLFVLIDALPGSSARVTACEGGAKQLAVSRTGNQLKVAPLLVASAAAGQATFGNMHCACVLYDDSRHDLCQHLFCAAFHSHMHACSCEPVCFFIFQVPRQGQSPFDHVLFL